MLQTDLPELIIISFLNAYEIRQMKIILKYLLNSNKKSSIIHCTWFEFQGPAY